jgi:AmiR/NasT family two-component response regulator
MQAVNGGAREPRTVSLAARLEAQLVSMPVVEQAKGVLMARQGCDADQAFDRLCRAAQRSNLPLCELAEQIVKKTQQRRSGPA